MSVTAVPNSSTTPENPVPKQATASKAQDGLFKPSAP